MNEKIDGAWETVEPIIVDDGSYCVFGPWNTTDGTHILQLRFMYTGADVEYKADMMTVGSDGSLVGDELMSSPSMKGGGGLFTANFIFQPLPFHLRHQHPHAMVYLVSSLHNG